MVLIQLLDRRLYKLTFAAFKCLLFSVFFLRTYVLVSNVPSLPELASVWSCLIGKVSVGTLSSFLLSAESFSSCSVSMSPAIALSTLTWSSHSGWGATSSGMLAPPIALTRHSRPLHLECPPVYHQDLTRCLQLQGLPLCFPHSQVICFLAHFQVEAVLVDGPEIPFQ